MNKKYTIYFFLIALGFVFNVASAQEQPGLAQRADQLYKQYKYANAASIYLKLVDVKKPKLTDLERLADCYQKMNNYEAAENWYARVIQSPESKVENLIRYGAVLKSNFRYAEAKKVLEQYAAKSGDSKKVVNDILGCDSAQIWMKKPTGHKIRNEEMINTANADFSAFPIGDLVYYAAEPDGKGKTYGWTGNSFLKVYTATRSFNNELSASRQADININNETYHVGPVSSNRAGDILYLTRTYPGKNGEMSKDAGKTYKTHNLELFILKKVNGVWQAPQPFAYNDVKKYSIGHATLSNDEKTLYFVSDMPGGQGGTDIWYSLLNADGSWGTPMNAGNIINTNGNEMFPFLSADGKLFYSTNGLPGMGGLDVFSSIGKQNQWDKPQNLRYPINSPGDDFAFIANEQLTAGYLSSNRKGGKGSDDIYSFSYTKPKIILALSGITFNKKTNEKLSEVAVALYSGGREIIAKQVSKTDGRFFFELEEASDYSVLGFKTGFYADSASLTTRGIVKSDTLSVSLYLNPLFEKGKILALDNIHYDFDKDNIRADAAKILDELVRTMRDNPTLKIELGSHTDSRGADVYNLDLSQRRARSVVNYLVSRGIARDRMVAKGYGESKLLNKCSNGVKCSAAEHQANRRTEFTILEF